MSKKEETPKSTKDKQSEVKKTTTTTTKTTKPKTETKKPETKAKKDPEDWIEEILPKQKKTPAQKSKSQDLSDVAVNQIPGIGPAVAEKLISAGYLTLAAVAHASPIELAEHCEIGEQTAKRLISASRSQVGIGFKNAKELLQVRNKLVKISTQLCANFHTRFLMVM